jgi:hypothetical protein
VAQYVSWIAFKIDEEAYDNRTTMARSLVALEFAALVDNAVRYDELASGRFYLERLASLV